VRNPDTSDLRPVRSPAISNLSSARNFRTRTGYEFEPCLREMAVRRQRLQKSQLAHHDEARAIRE
jgi:hypothetical protein